MAGRGLPKAPKMDYAAPMQDFAHRRATYADLEAVPPNLVAELIGGELVAHPRHRLRHSVSYSSLGWALSGPFQFGRGGPGGWWILDEPELHLGDDVLVPDIAGWRKERLPKIPDEAFCTVAPDWVCEIASPSTAKHDRGAKRDIYARHGVRHIWLVDPDARLLEAFQLGADGRWLPLKTYKDKDSVDAAPFAAAPFDLNLLWAD